MKRKLKQKSLTDFGFPKVQTTLKLGNSKIEHDLALMRAKLSLYYYLRNKCGELQKHKKEWIEVLERMLKKHKHEMSQIAREAVEETLRNIRL